MIITDKAIRERPILFSAPMVRAILDGTKTQTRRVVVSKHSGPLDGEWTWERWQAGYPDGRYRGVFEYRGEPIGLVCPYGQIQNRLWVRETWWIYDEAAYRDREVDGLMYRADLSPDDLSEERAARRIAKPEPSERWRSPRFMPRWASRLTLEITNVRVERLHEISEKDAEAEGFAGWYQPMHPDHGSTDGRLPSEEFAEAWRKIHGDLSWTLNPWVWVVTFRRIDKPVVEITDRGSAHV